ncbi:hypothetical protein AC579_1848 [Pseudocercospora musae]|uniref:Uncharacterized protein n=1 Tax=Pseudocercospora musae TaxID=113226 RepID=A0A139I6X4_9PEZI|nr:hypothetical protein AC579_1848 [Pseudocercospora musae]
MAEGGGQKALVVEAPTRLPASLMNALTPAAAATAYGYGLGFGYGHGHGSTGAPVDPMHCGMTRPGAGSDVAGWQQI